MTRTFNARVLDQNGLNLQAVFNLADLPSTIVASLQSLSLDLSQFTQLLVFGNGGPKLWSCLNEKETRSSDPIDDYSEDLVSSFLKDELNGSPIEFIYPGSDFTGLRDLGVLAGWHHPSLFRIGINEQWGTWFAYRAAVLTRSNYEPTLPMGGTSPCDTCTTRICKSACPAKAVTEDAFLAETCFDWRAREGSPCADKCPARAACPAGVAQRYSTDQIAYHYGLSLRAIKRMAQP